MKLGSEKSIRMNPLKTNRRVLTWLCGITPTKSTSKLQKIAYIGLTSFVMIGHLLSVAASSVFIYRNISDNLKETLFALMHVVSAASMIYQSVVTSLLRRKIDSIFKRLSTIYNESKRVTKLLVFV